MQTKIEKIGDGFGLLLPKELLDSCGFGTEVIVTVQNSTLIVSQAPQKAHQGWAEALAAIPQEELNRDFEDLRSFIGYRTGLRAASAKAQGGHVHARIGFDADY